MLSSKLVRGVVVLASSAALAGPALAQEATPEVSPVRFYDLAADGAQTEIDAQIGIHFIEDMEETLLNFRLSGQAVAKSGAGGFFALSGARISGDEESEEALGNIEIGGLYRMAQGESSVTLRAGLMLPTGAGAEDFDSFLNLISLIRTRPGDLITGAPEVTALRGSIAPAYQSGNVFLRGDVGLDVVIKEREDEFSSETDPLYHIDLAAGVKSGQAAGTVSLSTLGSTGENDEGHFHALAFGAQFDTGSAIPHASIVIPFTTGMGDGDDELTSGATLLLGVAGKM